jgi:hypothetical protein
LGRPAASLLFGARHAQGCDMKGAGQTPASAGKACVSRQSMHHRAGMHLLSPIRHAGDSVCQCTVSCFADAAHSGTCQQSGDSECAVGPQRLAFACSQACACRLLCSVHNRKRLWNLLGSRHYCRHKCMFVCCHTCLTRPALVGPKALQYGGDIGNAARRASGSVGLQVN